MFLFFLWYNIATLKWFNIPILLKAHTRFAEHSEKLVATCWKLKSLTGEILLEIKPAVMKQGLIANQTGHPQFTNQNLKQNCDPSHATTI